MIASEGGYTPPGEPKPAEPRLTKRWWVYPKLPDEVSQALLNFPPILRQIFYNRGLKTQAEVLSYLAALPPEGTQPENMLGMAQAVERASVVLGIPVDAVLTSLFADRAGLRRICAPGDGFSYKVRSMPIGAAQTAGPAKS